MLEQKITHGNKTKCSSNKAYMNANHAIFFRYQKKSIFSIPMATTPAAEPMINILPPVPAE